ncbi:MAG: YbhB/YbcL family Raf kinase inhibitor-like protein [Ignavibacteria bacterium]|jgi:Raf kinase inhibitor-like YbhB/YbcL family protein
MKNNLYLIKIYLLIIPVLVFLSCGTKEQNVSTKTNPEKKVVSGTKEKKDMSINITSVTFDEGGLIPSKYTCDDQNMSPPLSLSSVPDTAKSLALICDDPDAPSGTWVHWVMYNIPPQTKELPEGIPAKKELPDGTKQGLNDFHDIGYGGPCPPGGTHRYFFKIYALDTELKAGSDITKQDLLDMMKDHILAQGQLMGKYSRQ